MNLTIFNQHSLLEASRKFFEELNIPLHSYADEALTAQDALPEKYKEREPFTLIEEIYVTGMVDDAAFADKEGARHDELTEDYEGILILTANLKQRENNLLPTRSQLAEISRAFNQDFKYVPVVVLFKYHLNDVQYLAFANTERLTYKQQWREGEKAGKVTLLKEVSINNPHSGHLKILEKLKIPISGKNAVDSFKALYDYWQNQLSISILNNEFYKKLSFWYFWARKHVWFPDDVEKDEKKRNSDNLIRLLTRIIFIWFLKEKKLVPEEIFDEEYLQEILKDFYSNEGQSNVFYPAILQNLFFGTLNQSIQNRRFAKSGSFQQQKKEYGVKNIYRYPHLFEIDEQQVLKLFEKVPFLNGGLFDCLDKEDKNKTVVYVDGFTRKKSKMAVVPDFLFFGDDTSEDLSEEFGQKNKTYKEASVKGLINLLKEYKFTIDENTPLEEEVALDPELLGRVFENLLASYNPETQTTARKQTGSFYTPREIVNYMVDESIVAHLKNELSDSRVFRDFGKTQGQMFPSQEVDRQPEFQVIDSSSDNKVLDSKLQELVSYSEGQPFDKEEQKQKIVEAIHNIKILDPACGSGAFPMGALHKMVHILKKIDPQNIYWRELQKKKALKETEEAYNIGNKQEREKRLKEIDDSFENNLDDYGRKLYLIENTIFGVDIQPIAVQISKLRFFISLVVDQLESTQKEENYGIRALPNLETKFVAADSLVELLSSNQLKLDLFNNTDIDHLKNDLVELRHFHFNATKREEKVKIIDQDEVIRGKLKEVIKSSIDEESQGLKKEIDRIQDEISFYEKQKDNANKSKDRARIEKGIKRLRNDLIKKKEDLRHFPNSDEIADKISSWEPFDQNKSAGFFDPEWMFGLSDNFDVVIGNPPYLRIQGIQETNPKLVPYAKQKYASAQKGNWDLYALFTEKGYQLLNKQGILAYIEPHKFFQAEFGDGLRNYIAREKAIYKIVHFGASQVFENATNYTCLFFLQKAKRDNFQFVDVPNPEQWLVSPVGFEEYSLQQPNPNQKWAFINPDKQKVMDRIKKQKQVLGDVTKKIFQGIATSADKIYVLKTINWNNNTVIAYSSSLEREVELEKGFVKPFLMGKDVKRYQYPKPGRIVIFPYKIQNGKATLMTQDEIKTKYPLSWEYLLTNRDELENRERGRMKHENFYAYIYPKNLADFDSRKIITPEIANSPKLSLDIDGTCYHTTKVYSFVFNKNLKESENYWLGLLNSNILWFFLSNTGYVLRGGFYVFKTEYLKPFPVKRIDFSNANEKKLHDEIVDLVSEILETKSKGSNNQTIDTGIKEEEINRKVFELYGLSEEEIGIVEGETK